MSKNTKPATKGQKIFVWITFGILVLVIAIIVTNPGPKAKYQASTTGMSVIDDATVSVSFKIANVGKASGEPYCTLSAHDDSWTYVGEDTFTLKSINPGQTVNSADSLTVTKQGANNVTAEDIKCQ